MEAVAKKPKAVPVIEDEQSSEPANVPNGMQKKSSWIHYVELISVQGLVKNMPYLIFITFLGIMYISNKNRAIVLSKEIGKQNKELTELKWKYMDLKSRLMYQTSESQLAPKAMGIGIMPLDKPAFEINVKTTNKASK